MRNLILFVGFGVVCLLISLVASFATVDAGLPKGHGQPYWGDSDSPQALQAQRLATQAGCLACHSYRGQLGQVTGPTLDDVGSKLNQEAIASFIRNGTDLMPAYENKLTEEEIQLISEWMSKFKNPHSK